MYVAVAWPEVHMFRTANGGAQIIIPLKVLGDVPVKIDLQPEEADALGSWLKDTPK